MISLSPTAPESTPTAVVVFPAGPAAAAAFATIHHSLDGGIHTHTMTHRRRPRPASASVMVVLSLARVVSPPSPTARSRTTFAHTPPTITPVFFVVRIVSLVLSSRLARSRDSYRLPERASTGIFAREPDRRRARRRDARATRASSREDEDETEKNVPLERERGRYARVRDVETTTDGLIVPRRARVTRKRTRECECESSLRIVNLWIPYCRDREGLCACSCMYVVLCKGRIGYHRIIIWIEIEEKRRARRAITRRSATSRVPSPMSSLSNLEAMRLKSSVSMTREQRAWRANEIHLVDVSLVAALLGEPAGAEGEPAKLVLVLSLVGYGVGSDVTHGPTHDTDDEEGVARGENFTAIRFG